MTLRIGTRGSPLALTQAQMVADALLTAHGWPADAVTIVPVTTTGDRVQDRPLAEIGGKALWTKELERALLDRAIDVAVHSMKDVEVDRPEGLAIGAMLPRADVADRLLGAVSIDAVPNGGVFGTSSPRRRAQLLRLRPDLRVVPLRGNVDTRLAKLAAGEVDATLLAAAGLDRLGRDALGVRLPIEIILSAPGQGAIGIEARADDGPTLAALAPIDHPSTRQAVTIERLFLAALHATCHSPVAAYALCEGARWRLRAQLFSPDGQAIEVAATRGSLNDMTTACDFARDMLARAPAEVRAAFPPP